MNVTNTNTVDPTNNVGQNFYINTEGNRVELPFATDSDGETAQPETTIFVAEDAADRPITVH